MIKRLLQIALLFAPVPALAQYTWSGILAPARADQNWPNAGAQNIPSVGSLPNCPTQLSPSNVTATTIANAFTADSGSGSYCVLNIPAGTFNMGSTSVKLTYAGQSNVVINGAGPNLTFITWSGTPNFTCNGIGSTAWCLWNGDGQTNAGSGSWANSASITGGLTQGSTTITLSTVSGGSPNLNPLTVGTLLQFAQKDQSSDPGNIYYCDVAFSSNACSLQGGAAVPYIAGTHANLNQEVYVKSCGATMWGAACTSNNVVLSSPVKSADWNLGQSPTAWWPFTKPVENVGIQNLSLDVSTVENKFIVECHDCKNVWFSGVRTLNNSTYPNSSAEHYLMWQGVNQSVFNSYMYGSNASSEGYGIAWEAGSSDSLAYNNIAQHVASAYMIEPGTGDVYAYNFATDNYFGSGWQQCDNYTHMGGSNFNLFEGNDGICIAEDDIHGTGNYNTYYREYMNGRNPATYNFNCPSPCVNPPYEPISSGGQNYYDATVAIGINSYNRYENVVANVWGTPGFHNVYQNIGLGGNPTSCPSFSFTVIYTLGFGNGNQHPNSTTCGGVDSNNGPLDNDMLVSTTLMRWGNYDVVNGTTQYNSSETASGAPLHPGLSSPNTVFPASFAGFNTTPTWWNFPGGSASPFPANGPDVSGGPGPGGHHYVNPANYCYHTIMGGLDDGSSGPLTFNPAACYPGGGTPTASAPTFSPASPYSGAATTVTLASSTPGSTTEYCQDTTNNCTPSTTGTSVSFTSTGYIRAFATASGYLQSGTSSWQGTIATPTVSNPSFSPDGNLTGDGYFLTNPTVTIAVPSGATCGYTTDGSTPTASAGTITHGTTYSTPFALTVTTGGTQLQAICSRSGYNNSAVVSSTYFQRNIVVNTHNSTSGGPATLTSITTTVTPLSGDGIACQVVLGAAAPPITVTVSDNKNAGNYTACVPASYGSGPSASEGKFFISGAAAGSTTVTAAFSQATQWVGIACKDLEPASAGTMFCDPAAAPSPNTVSNTGTSPATGGATPAHASEFIDCGLVTASGTGTAGTGYFLSDTIPNGPNLFTEYQIQNAAASVTCPFSVPSANNTIVQQGGYYFASNTPAATPTFSPPPGTYSTVQTITLADSTVPASEENVQDSLTGWDECYIGTCPGGGSPGGSGTPSAVVQTINNATPSLSGASMKLGFTTSQSNTNVLWTYTGNGCDECANFHSDFQLYPPATSTGVQALEMDMFNFDVTDNTEFMFGFQWNQASSVWQVFNQNLGTWVSTSVTTPPTFGAWNHIQVFNHRVPGDTSACSGHPCMYYDSFVLNGVAHALNITEPAGTLPGGWTSAIGFQYQMDSATVSGSTTFTEYLDEASLIAGSTIYYTEDGSTPSTSSSIYVNPFTLSSNATVRAIATAPGYSQSPVGSATYTINTGLSSPPLLKAVQQ